eukprot:CAMPEP_0175459816 /NCGR_PEP_ID=MMETSP0095-20121207/67318_1 /TAXON_ID=311494 /ORGANISM="Alexandrium monilatum, Strain CCMP3105" /LENGTH=192 /DNA_ID=CAMNT_0016760807 /DNA_START=210 /DNA_END=786 /DNA_ORIENTATION=-
MRHLGADLSRARRRCGCTPAAPSPSRTRSEGGRAHLVLGGADVLRGLVHDEAAVPRAYAEVGAAPPVLVLDQAVEGQRVHLLAQELPVFHAALVPDLAWKGQGLQPIRLHEARAEAVACDDVLWVLALFWRWQLVHLLARLEERAGVRADRGLGAAPVFEPAVADEAGGLASRMAHRRSCALAGARAGAGGP